MVVCELFSSGQGRVQPGIDLLKNNLRILLHYAVKLCRKSSLRILIQLHSRTTSFQIACLWSIKAEVVALCWLRRVFFFRVRFWWIFRPKFNLPEAVIFQSALNFLLFRQFFLFDTNLDPDPTRRQDLPFVARPNRNNGTRNKPKGWLESNKLRKWFDPIEPAQPRLSVYIASNHARQEQYHLMGTVAQI